MTRAICLVSLCVLAAGCAGIPEGIEAVEGFELGRYLGRWYEIARLDHSFERGLTNVTATYARRDDGGVAVRNRGFDPKKNGWRDAEGRAYFLDDASVGRFKVTFFWPFYGGYNIFHLDKDRYQYALVCGNDRSYLWVLCRVKKPGKELMEKLLSVARQKGFDVSKLIFVSQEKTQPGS